MNVFKIIVPIALAAILSGCPTTPATTTKPPINETGNTSYKLTVTKSGDGTVQGSGIECGSTCSIDIAKDDNVLLAATPGTGSTFVGWSGACTGTENCTVSMTAEKTVFANFKTANTSASQTLNINFGGTGAGSVKSNPTGIDCSIDCSSSFAKDTSVTLTATPNASSSFSGWGGGECSGTGTCTTTMNASKTVTANFTGVSASDTTKPTVNISSPATGQTVSSATLNVTGTASDNTAVTSLEYSLNNAARVALTANSNFSFPITLIAGLNTIRVYASDAAGNEGVSSITVTYNLPDTTPPTITIGNPSDGQTLSVSTIRGIGFASDAGGIANVQYSINGGPRINLGRITGNFEFGIVLQPGSNTITLYATDNAGNTNSTSVTVTYTPPSFTITPEQNIFFVGQKSVAFWKVNISGRQNFNTSGAAFDNVTLENNAILGTGASKIQFSYRKTDSNQDEIVLEIGAGSSVPVGDYTMTVRATSGSIVQESAVTVRVAPCSLGCQ